MSCPTPEKKVYLTQLEAAINLFKITAVEGHTDREQRAYPCGGHWHLTSMPYMSKKR